jgi:regulator of replication initiation timing
MRKYFDCPDCGKRTWVSDDTMFTGITRETCVDCWDPPKGPRHCECGSFAQAGSKYCWRCERIHKLESEVKDLRSELHQTLTEKTTCQTHNRELKSQVNDLSSKVKAYQSKKEHPFKVRVFEWNGTMTEARLKELMECTQPVRSIIKLEYDHRG